MTDTSTWEPTSCPTLVITAVTSDDEQPQAGGDRFALIHAPTGCRIAGAAGPVSLRELARRMAWFDGCAVDPGYLADPAHAQTAASVCEIVGQWRIDTDRAALQAVVLDTGSD